MTDKITKSKRLNFIFDVGLFRIVYLITLSFETIAFCDKIAIIFRCVVLAWGAIILVFKFIIEPRAFNVKYKWLMWSFILVGIFTSFWNLSGDFPENMVFVYHTMICFFIFYAMNEEKSHDGVEREMLFLFKYFIIFSTLTSFAGILVALFGSQINIGNYFLGILRNRLIGIHTNSNLLAFCNIVSIFSIDVLNDGYLRWKYKNRCLGKTFLAVSCLINYVSLFLSDSNASFLFVVVYFTVRIFYSNFISYNDFKISKFIRGNVLMLVCSTLMISGSFLLRDMCQEVMGRAISDIHKFEEPITDDEHQDIIVDTETTEELEKSMIDDEQVVIGRENYDVSSGRITLLHQGLQLFKVNPIIGIGRGNLVGYGEKYLENGLIFSDLHNSYLTILVSYGIVGFLIFGVFSLVTAKDMSKHLIGVPHGRDSMVYSKLFSAVVAYCAYSLFEKAILSEITFMVVFFWLIVGYTMSYVSNGQKQN